MAEQTDAAPQQPKSGWRTLVDTVVGWPISRKIALAAVTVITLGLFAFIIVQARTADYQLLYGNLADSDAAAVVEWLKGKNVPYQLTMAIVLPKIIPCSASGKAQPQIKSSTSSGLTWGNLAIKPFAT